MSKVYLLLAKHGDICGLIPILFAEWMETKVSPTLIVCKAYSEIPLALEWLTVVIYAGEWDDLKGALKFAKQLCANVVVAQCHGKDFPIRRLHPSYQLDLYDRCGRLSDFGKLELVLPHPVLSRDSRAKFIPSSTPYIIYADHSQSSPFLAKEELFTLLSESFPTHQIIRMSGIRFARLLDALPLFEEGDLIVSIDTLWLHLSAAVETPVIALVTDEPSRWRGSCYHPRMAMHLRYGDWEARKSELIFIAKKCLALKK